MADKDNESEAVIQEAVIRDDVIHDVVTQSPAQEGASINARVAKNEAVVDADKLRTQGQRRINLIWEVTQALVALMVTGTGMWVAGNLAISGNNESAFLLLGNTLFLVIGAYFSRTNHQKMGGIGTKLEGETR